jgi:hypothetical protein
VTPMTRHAGSGTLMLMTMKPIIRPIAANS